MLLAVFVLAMPRHATDLADRVVADVWARAINLDRNQMEQVLVNVLKNAMEAIGENGRIDLGLTTETEGTSGATLTIRDTGPGLTPEALQRLFTPFYSTERDGRGLGLTRGRVSGKYPTCT